VLLVALRYACHENNVPKPAWTGARQEPVLQRQAARAARARSQGGSSLLPAQTTRTRASAGSFFHPSFLLFGILQGLFAASSASARAASAGVVTDLLCTITCLFPRRQPGIRKQPGLVPRALSGWADLGGVAFPSPCGDKAETPTPSTSINKAEPEMALLGLPAALQVSSTHTTRKRYSLLPSATAASAEHNGINTEAGTERDSRVPELQP